MANVENILDETGSVKAKLAEGNMRGVRGEEKATVVGATAARIADLLGQLKKEVSHTLTFDLLEARSVIEALTTYTVKLHKI
jgi:hypothetical protein